MGRDTTRWAAGSSAALALAALWAAIGCAHPWDDYEYLPGDAAGGGGAAGASGGGGGGAAPAWCGQVCRAYEQCAGTEWPTCEAECATCNEVYEQQAVTSCADNMVDCPGDALGFQVCVNSTTVCMDVP